MTNDIMIYLICAGICIIVIAIATIVIAISNSKSKKKIVEQFPKC